MRRIEYGLRACGKTDRLRRRDRVGIDDRLLILQVLVERKQEAGALRMPQRSGYRSFVVLSPLRRFDGSKSIASIENGIAKQKVERAMKVGRAALCNDFKAGTAGP